MTDLDTKVREVANKYAYQKINLAKEIKALIKQELEALRMEIKEDYINWLLVADRKDYKGSTPFSEWKQEAEVREMSRWT